MLESFESLLTKLGLVRYLKYTYIVGEYKIYLYPRWNRTEKLISGSVFFLLPMLVYINFAFGDSVSIFYIYFYFSNYRSTEIGCKSPISLIMTLINIRQLCSCFQKLNTTDALWHWSMLDIYTMRDLHTNLMYGYKIHHKRYRLCSEW